MGAMAVLPRSRPLTRADLASMPDDGHRYELVDGALVVTPAPSIRHQAVLAALYHLLRQQCPAGLTVPLCSVGGRPRRGHRTAAGPARRRHSGPHVE